MRKILYIVISFATIFIVSCTKYTSYPTPQDSQRSYIFFEPSVNDVVDSKANLVTGQVLPKEKNTALGVLGYYNGTSLFNASYSKDVEKVYRPEDNDPFTYQNMIFWRDMSADHHFFAFYPYSNKIDGTPFTVVANNGNPYVVYSQPTANDASMVDFMTAYTSTPKCPYVDLKFFHRLWALDVAVTNAQTHGLNNEDQITTEPTLTIKSVSVIVNDFPEGANFYIDRANTPSKELSTTLIDFTYTVNAIAENGDILANSGETTTKKYGPLTFLPVPAETFRYSLRIVYLDSRGGEATFTTAAKTVTQAFEEGKRYVLTVNKTNDTFIIGTYEDPDGESGNDFVAGEWHEVDVNHTFN